MPSEVVHAPKWQEWDSPGDWDPATLPSPNTIREEAGPPRAPSTGTIRQKRAPPSIPGHRPDPPNGSSRPSALPVASPPWQLGPCPQTPAWRSGQVALPLWLLCPVIWP